MRRDCASSRSTDRSDGCAGDPGTRAVRLQRGTGGVHERLVSMNSNAETMASSRAAGIGANSALCR